MPVYISSLAAERNTVLSKVDNSKERFGRVFLFKGKAKDFVLETKSTSLHEGFGQGMSALTLCAQFISQTLLMGKYYWQMYLHSCTV